MFNAPDLYSYLARYSVRVRARTPIIQIHVFRNFLQAL
jgi:hypothetical protein